MFYWSNTPIFNFLNLPAGCGHCLPVGEHKRGSISSPEWWEQRCCRLACHWRTLTAPLLVSRWSLSIRFKAFFHGLHLPECGTVVSKHLINLSWGVHTAVWSDAIYPAFVFLFFPSLKGECKSLFMLNVIYFLMWISVFNVNIIETWSYS